MTREEKIAMIGGENLKPYPWTRSRIAVTAVFLALGGSLLALGIIFLGSGAAEAGIWLGSIIIAIMLLDIIFEYFCCERPNFVVKGRPKLRVLEFNPIYNGLYAVAGKDGSKYYLGPDMVIYAKNEQHSCFVFSGRLDSLFKELRIGKDFKEIVTLPE